MKQIQKAADLQAAVSEAKKQNLSIGLVPTMGALHEGHLSLIERALKENDLVVVSLFVNPIQFNNKEDLEKYPRTIEADLALIQKLESSIEKKATGLLAFTPTVDEMYPQGEPKEVYHFGPVEEVMEGPRRPGHFSGVAVVVRRLFDLAQPTRAYFGEKDYQQIAVIRRMVDDLGFKLEIVPCPVVRQSDGLAMSSRNTLLTDQERTTAANIYRIMNESRSLGLTVQQTHDYVVDAINSIDGLEVQYFSIVDGDSLADVSSWDDAPSIVGCITVFCGAKPIRLIDHIRYK